MLLIALCAVSCKATKTTTDSTANHGNRLHDIEKAIDTIYTFRHDSVFIRIKGDTVFVDKNRYDIYYRTRLDTVIKKDSVWFNRDVFIEHEKGLSWWQQMQMKSFWFLLIILLLIIIYALFKKYLKK